MKRSGNRWRFYLLELPYGLISFGVAVGGLYYVLSVQLSFPPTGVLALVVPTALVCLSALIVGYRIRYQLKFSDESGRHKWRKSGNEVTWRGFVRALVLIVVGGTSEMYAVGYLVNRREYFIGVVLALIGLAAIGGLMPFWRRVGDQLLPLTRSASNGSSASNSEQVQK